jgi:hypothetical protein
MDDVNSNNKINIYYRLSDKGEIKDKLTKVTNRSCLENFFCEFDSNEVNIIADNVTDHTYEWLKSYSVKSLHRTSLGNSASFWYCYELALTRPAGEYVYFVENDYIHREKSKEVLLEGLNIADYVTLYDHPDKYVDGMNPGVKNGGEVSTVYLTESTHWKKTNSTTMTFATRVSTLISDRFIFKLYSVGLLNRNYPIKIKKLMGRRVPADYRIFNILIRLKKRLLVSPVPGYASHGEIDYLSPFTMWEKYLR